MNDGQLWPAERAFLHEAVLQRNPTLVFEVGTWKGGGSTWQIREALAKTGSGKLVTCETNEDCWREAMKMYANDPYVVALNLPADAALEWAMRTFRLPIDFVFLDGPEDADETMIELEQIEHCMAKEAILVCHDWEPEFSVKMKKVRPYLESSPHWKMLAALRTPDSVGIAKGEYLG